MNISDVIHNFEDIVKFTNNKLVDKEIVGSTEKVRSLAKAIKNHKNIQIKKELSERVIIVDNKDFEIDKDSLDEISKIVEKFKLSFQELNNKLDFLYEKARLTDDKRVLDGIKEEVEDVGRSIQSQKKLSPRTQEALQDKRMQILKEINYIDQSIKLLEVMKKGKSMQGYAGEVLSHKGYELFEHIREKSQKEGALTTGEKNLIRSTKDIHQTTKAIKSIKNKLKEARVGLIKGLDIGELKEFALAIKSGTATEDQARIVVACKKLWMDLITEEGSYLEILDFVGKKGFEGLETA